MQVFRALTIEEAKKLLTGVGMAGTMRCDGDGSTEMHKWGHFHPLICVLIVYYLSACNQTILCGSDRIVGKKSFQWCVISGSSYA